MTWWWARPLLLTAKGATITFGSTLVSCALALQVEQSANRLFYYWMPHKYATVESAYGLTQEQLESVRHLRHNGSAGVAAPAVVMAGDERLSPTNDGESTAFRDNALIGFSTDTLFTASSERSKMRESLPIPQPWQQDVIACSMTG